MFQFYFKRLVIIAIFLPIVACQKANVPQTSVAPSALRDVPALRLNFRYEPDVPTPDQAAKGLEIEDRNAFVQSDFDQNRPQEILDMTITSPDKQRVLAVFHNVQDQRNEYRLEIYGSDGKSLKVLTHDGMAVHFPNRIVWSPDSSSVAFIAMARLGMLGGIVPDVENGKSGEPNPASATDPLSPIDANANSESAPDTQGAVEAPTQVPTAGAPVLTFRSEQIYIADSNGNEVKPVTQNEGLIYFYMVWSPDSSALAALAAKSTEWRIFEFQAEQRGEVFRPAGRPRIIEKTGRQRLLDDYPTAVHPVWSPDSAKLAAAFDKQIRVYDAVGNAPTQAAIMLRNQLLISSKSYDEINRPAPIANDNTSAIPTGNTNTPAPLPQGVLPDETMLVSFNPIVNLLWTEDSMLYFETAYVREFKESINNVRSNARWHRLIFSPQPVALGK